MIVGYEIFQACRLAQKIRAAPGSRRVTQVSAGALPPLGKCERIRRL